MHPGQAHSGGFVSVFGTAGKQLSDSKRQILFFLSELITKRKPGELTPLTRDSAFLDSAPGQCHGEVLMELANRCLYSQKAGTGKEGQYLFH